MSYRKKDFYSLPFTHGLTCNQYSQWIYSIWIDILSSRNRYPYFLLGLGPCITLRSVCTKHVKPSLWHRHHYFSSVILSQTTVEPGDVSWYEMIKNFFGYFFFKWSSHFQDTLRFLVSNEVRLIIKYCFFTEQCWRLRNE